jgi:cysteine desulfurase
MDEHRSIFGNPHSGHFLGAISRSALDVARDQVLSVFGLHADTWSCVFTSGASESNNLAIKGPVMHALRTNPEKPATLITSAMEHASVDKCVEYLVDLFEKDRVKADLMPVDEHGVIKLEKVEEMITEHVTLISCIQTVAETGAVEPVAEVAKISKQIAPNSIFHCDASQSVGKLSRELLHSLSEDVDLITVAGHKFGAPKGVGALLARKSVISKIDPLIHGAGQEFGLRGGTENVLFAIALGAACKEALNQQKSSELRDILWKTITEEFKMGDKQVDFRLNSTAPTRSPLTINFSVAGINGPALVSKLGSPDSGYIKVCFSAGSACHSRGCPTPSKVLAAMGIEQRYSTTGLRLSLGRRTTEAEVLEAGRRIARAIINV